MKKFSEIEYRRPDAESVKSSVTQYIGQMKAASSYGEMRSIYLNYKKLAEDLFTISEIASIRNTIDTGDSFYAEEQKFWNSFRPELMIFDQKMSRTILESPCRADWEKEFGPLFMKRLEMDQKLADPCIIPEMIEEGDLEVLYSKTSAAAQTVFCGESCNFYGLLKHLQNPDREERREAMIAWGNLYESISAELDDIYDRLVKVRARKAEKLGFSSYIDYIYLSRGRYDYSAEDVKNFRRQVKDIIVPMCSRLREMQTKHLSLDSLHYYDEALLFPEGNAVPIGDRDELVKKAQQMYHEISPETGEFFDFMVEHELFDLDTKPGKRGGGYCTFLPSYKAPFIFSNFNGTSADVDVLTHEAGHAFEAYTAAHNVLLSDMVFPTAEVAEIHSMSMEHFAYPYMDRFFGEKAADYRYSHLMDALEVIPYMVCVDEFQHRVFENLSMTAKDRRAVWHELEKTYLPWRNYDGHAFLESGGFWMQKQHIFLFPFYYIDYALAQMSAFEFYGRMKKDRRQAWADYYRFCQAGGSRGYFDLLKLAGLSNPFEEGSIEKIAESLKEDLLL